MLFHASFFSIYHEKIIYVYTHTLLWKENNHLINNKSIDNIYGQYSVCPWVHQLILLVMKIFSTLWLKTNYESCHLYSTDFLDNIGGHGQAHLLRSLMSSFFWVHLKAEHKETLMSSLNCNGETPVDFVRFPTTDKLMKIWIRRL